MAVDTVTFSIKSRDGSVDLSYVTSSLQDEYNKAKQPVGINLTTGKLSMFHALIFYSNTIELYVPSATGNVLWLYTRKLWTVICELGHY